MNFLIFRDFSEFKIDLFELNSLNYIFLYRILMWQVILRRRKSAPPSDGIWTHHVASHMCVHACACMCVCVRMRVCAHVKREIGFLFRITLSPPLSPHLIYTLELSFKSHVGLCFLFFKCADDVAARGVFNARVEDESSIFTYGKGYAAQSYLSANHF